MLFEDGVAAYEFTDGMEFLLEGNPHVGSMPELFGGTALRNAKPSEFSLGGLSDHVGVAYAQGLDVIHLVDLESHNTNRATNSPGR